MRPKFPEIEVHLSGKDGNALSIIAHTSAAMKRAGISEGDIAAYREAAMSGDYDNVLQTTMATVNVA